MSVSYDPARVTVVDHPLVQHKLSILRDEKTGTKTSSRSLPSSRAMKPRATFRSRTCR